MTSEDRLEGLVIDLILVTRDASERMEYLEAAVREAVQYEIIITPEEPRGTVQ